MHKVLLGVLWRTALWAVPLGLVIIAAALHDDGGAPILAYASYIKIVWVVAVATITLLVYGVKRGTRYVDRPLSLWPHYWHADATLIAILVFWALAPPSYFFVEYYAFDQELIACKPSGAGKAGCLATLKLYADNASKIWAGASAVFLAIIGLAKRA